MRKQNASIIRDPAGSQMKGKWRFSNMLISHEARDNGQGGVQVLILPVKRVRKQKTK